MLPANLVILIIENNFEYFALVSECLEQSFANATVFHADTLQKGIDFIEKENITVILLDLILPDQTGIQSFRSVNAKAPLIPVIILSGLDDTNLTFESLQTGAQDCLFKDDISPAVLTKSIHYCIQRSKKIVALKESEEQYKHLFYNNPVPVCAYDSESCKLLMANQALLQHYGYDEQELLELTFDELKHPAGQTNNSAFESANNGNNETLQNIELHHRKKNGEIIDVEIRSRQVLIKNQHAELTVIYDVTERNKARQRLLKNEEMFRTILENFPNGSVAVLNKDLTISYIAGKEFPVPGAKPSDFENTSFPSHFHSPEEEKIHNELIKVFEKKPIVFEVTRDNVTYIVSAVPLHENEGKIHKILTASQNITEQKRNEIEKEMLIGQLRQINSDLQQFSYITSHNLRAPLSNILSLINLIDISSVIDDNAVMLLKNLKESALQLNDTVNDLINILIIKNNIDSEKEKIDIRKIFEKVVQSVQTFIEEKTVTIHTDFNEAFEIYFNRSYLESILLNLLTNAIKYSSPERAAEIKIITKKTDGGVKLYFGDNGLGIDLLRNKDRIFGLYQRFHGNADSKGLGLYIVNSQVRVMGGEIDVESEVDKGTTFIITFKN